MTTAFTAMPMKITTSTMRFFGGDMVGPYPTPSAASIGPVQFNLISVELNRA